MHSIPSLRTPVPVSDAPLLATLLKNKVCAGFPSPAEDLGAQRIDLVQLLVVHTQATYFLRASGQSMVEAGIFDRDILVVDRAVSADTAEIVGAALAGLRSIYRPGFKMAKAGVMLMQLQPDSVQQQELELEDDEVVDRSRLMTTLDNLNQRYGRGTVLMASAGLARNQRTWSMKQERRTPG